MKISIVIPAFNEADNIEMLHERLIDVLENSKVDDYELIFIDDGSTDATLEKLKKLANADSRAFYLSFSRNFGHQAALRAGLTHARGDAIITMDADLQHPPRLIPKMIARWKEGFEIVYTRRHSGNETGALKKLLSNGFYRLLNRLSGLEMDAGAADFRLIDGRVAAVIKEMPEPNLFLRGFMNWSGFSAVAIDYKPDKRHAGASKYSMRKMISLALHGVTQFSVKPLRLASILGVTSSFFGFLYGAYAVFIYFAYHNVISGWTSVVVCVLIMNGCELIVLGIIGEYLGRTFMQTKQRPDYIIKENGLRNL